MGDPRPTSLSDLVTLALDRQGVRSLAELKRRAEAGGHTIAATTLSEIRRGTYHARPSPDRLAALAFLAKVPLREVERIAGERVPERRFVEELPRDVDLLTPRERQAIIGLLRALIENHKDADEAEGGDSSDDQAPESGIVTATAESLGLSSSNGYQGEDTRSS